MTLLTPNFDSREFDSASVNEVGAHVWPAGYDVQRVALAVRAQWLRDLAGSSGVVTSAYRSPAHNSEIGGVSTSQHMKAEALDILFPFVSLRALATRILADVDAGRAPSFGQIILYNDKGHVHISLATMGVRNGEMLLSTGEINGVRQYAPLSHATLERVASVSGAQARGGLRPDNRPVAGHVVDVSEVTCPFCHRTFIPSRV